MRDLFCNLSMFERRKITQQDLRVSNELIENNTLEKHAGILATACAYRPLHKSYCVVSNMTPTSLIQSSQLVYSILFKMLLVNLGKPQSNRIQRNLVLVWEQFIETRLITVTFTLKVLFERILFTLQKEKLWWVL